MRCLRLLILVLAFALALPAYASETVGTVLPSDRYAWGDLIGWINFAPDDDQGYRGLVITDDRVTGFAWSRDHGWINFNPTSSGQGVTNTPEGDLGGSAWVSSLGWISMQGVTINESGEFVGIAGNAGTDTARVSFDCSTCSVRTDWRPASVRTGDDDGGNDGTGGGGSPGGGTRTFGTDASGAGQGAALPGTGLPGFVNALFPGFFGGPTAAAQGTGAGGAPDGTDADGDGIPDYLFDIQMRLEKSVLVPTDTLTAYVSYVSFGTLPTPVRALYTVYDANRTIVATSEDAFIVETERAETKRFPDLMLAPGSYTLHLSVTYGSGTVEEFDQPFTVARDTGLACWLPWPLSWLASHVPIIAWIVAHLGCWFPWLLLLILAGALYGMYRTLRRMRHTHHTAGITYTTHDH